MITINKKYNTLRIYIFVVFVLSLVMLTMFVIRLANASIDVRDFNPGNIISDYVMTNKHSMSQTDIERFLKSKSNCRDYDLNKARGSINGDYIIRSQYRWHIKDGHFVCLAEEDFNGESASKIIWQAAQDFNINPQVLIVLLEKEQGLITDSYPNNVQYNTATGYGCPDTAACDSYYYGFKNQVRNAARFFSMYQEGNKKWYKLIWPGDKYTGEWEPFTYNIQFHPNSSCGSSSVYVENRSTASLYSYTPYQPDKQALAAQRGTGGSCSSYGNRNFWIFFNDWFGSTQVDDTNYPHPDGTTVDINGKVYLIEGGSLHHVVSGGIFESHGYKWNEVKRATAGDRNLPITWSLDFVNPKSLYTDNKTGVYRTVEKGGMYYRQLVSYNSFTKLGYKWNEVYKVSDKYMPDNILPEIYIDSGHHFDGTLISNNGKVFLIDHGTLRYVSAPVFNSYGWEWGSIKVATAEDLSMPVGENMLFRKGSLIHSSDGNLFIVQHRIQGSEIMRPIGPYRCFSSIMGYSVEEAVNVSISQIPTARGINVTCGI